MKLVIFGATGGVGKHVVAQVLAKGQNVTAFTRHPDKLCQSHANLEIAQGDILSPEIVKRAVTGCDNVLCALGMPLLNNDGLRRKGTVNIVRAMTETGVKRLICLSALGSGESHTALPALHRYVLRPTLMRRLYKDHEAQEKCVMQSNLDWTIVRPGSFASGGHTGKYRHGFTTAEPGLTYKISREDVADFMLAQIETDSYMRHAANLSY